MCFSGQFYIRLDTQRDGWHAFSISHLWKELDSDLDAVFSYDEKLYMIKVSCIMGQNGCRGVCVRGEN